MSDKKITTIKPTIEKKKNIVSESKPVLNSESKQNSNLKLNKEVSEENILKLKDNNPVDDNPVNTISKKRVSKKNTNNKPSKEEKVYKEIKLYDYQKEHIAILNNILSFNSFGLDFSCMGLGKTYTSSKIYQLGGYKHLIIISPVSVKTKWCFMEKEHGIKIDRKISYTELRSVKFRQPKHGLLSRKDFTTKIVKKGEPDRDMDKVLFTSTELYKKMIDEGLLLVIDEIQNIKNSGNQLDAVKEMIRPIMENFEAGKGTSRVLLLSGSPMDKKEQVLNLFKCLNIMKEDKISFYNPYEEIMIHKGLIDIENYCISLFGNEKINEIKHECFGYRKMEFASGKIILDYAYSIFLQIIKKHLSHAMVPQKSKTIITKENAYYRMKKSDKDLLIKGIEFLKAGTGYNPLNQTVDLGTNGIQALKRIQRGLIMIETSKINCFTRVASEALDKNPKQKVVICLNYSDTVCDLMDSLKKYNPLCLIGKMNAKQRLEILDKFQAPSTECRLLIGNLSICSTGIDLDDQHGEYPRLCLVSPNYNTITLYQLSHRFQRAETKSNSTVHFLFGDTRTDEEIIDGIQKIKMTELSILNALSKKSTIMKEISQEQLQMGIIYPGDYKQWLEIKAIDD